MMIHKQKDLRAGHFPEPKISMKTNGLQTGKFGDQMPAPFQFPIHPGGERCQGYIRCATLLSGPLFSPTHEWRTANDKPRRGALTKPRPTAWVGRRDNTEPCKGGICPSQRAECGGKHDSPSDDGEGQTVMPPLQGLGKIDGWRTLTQAVGRGLVRAPLWG